MIVIICFIRDLLSNIFKFVFKSKTKGDPFVTLFWSKGKGECLVALLVLA